MKVNIVKTIDFNSKKDTYDCFPSLRAAIEYAKQKSMEDLYLVKVVIKDESI